MIRIRRFPAIALLVLGCLLGGRAMAAGLDIPSGAYELEPTHAYVTFSYSHLGFSTPHVGFNQFDVQLALDADEPAKSSFRAEVNPASIDSRVPLFDEHLVGENFFHVEKYPNILFESTAIKMTSDNTADIVGNLTIKDVTRSVTLQATINKATNHPMLGKPHLGVNAQTKLKRTEWNLGRYAPNVGDEVDIYISVELQKAK